MNRLDELPSTAAGARCAALVLVDGWPDDVRRCLESLAQNVPGDTVIVALDLGNVDGSGGDLSPAEQVVQEIKGMGGEAVANGDDISSWEGAQRLINTAIETFGDINIVVNNAGILRDRMLTNMTEEEWDAVIKVHLKGTFGPSRWAAAYWREQVKAGKQFLHTVTVSPASHTVFDEVSMEVVSIPAWSPLAGCTLGAISPAQRHGVLFAGLNRHGRRVLNPSSTEELRAGDEVLALGTPQQIRGFKAWLQEKPAESGEARP